MILTVDCGNTRIKWALYAGADAPVPVAVAQGAVLLGHVAELDAAWAQLPAPQKILVANVAGPAVRGDVSRRLSHWAVAPQWVVSAARACGVSNAYDAPSQLGVDRWAALLAAWQRQRAACLVVCAGTATTIDSLDANGVFPGGVILPGVDLMKKALAGNTAGLPLADGRYERSPRRTADAIESGCLDAQAGAIERRHAQLPAGAACLITGGGAAAIAMRLNIAASVVDNLVLEGLLALSRDSA